MARFSRFLVGGFVGAGLALLFAPKPGRELRRLLMGGERKALPAPEEVYYAPADYEPAAAAEAVDLESRIEETRRQVEAQIEETLTAAPPAEAEEEAMTGAVEAPVEKKEAWAAPAPREAVEVEFPAEEAEEAEAEQMIPGEEKEPVTDMVSENEVAMPEAVIPEEAPAEAPATEVPAPPQEVAAPAVPAEEEGWEALKTPSEGEPSLEAELTSPGEPVEEAAAPEPSGIDREEMRRRIDETRARLKAKAFDAMVSGETFIDETGAEKAAEHEEADTPGIDKEIDEQIDESLKEQD